MKREPQIRNPYNGSDEHYGRKQNSFPGQPFTPMILNPDLERQHILAITTMAEKHACEIRRLRWWHGQLLVALALALAALYGAKHTDQPYKVHGPDTSHGTGNSKPDQYS